MAAGGFFAPVFIFNEINKSKKTADLYRSAGRVLFFIILTHPPQNNTTDNCHFCYNTYLRKMHTLSKYGGHEPDKEERDRQQNFQTKYLLTLSVRSFLLYCTKL